MQIWIAGSIEEVTTAVATGLPTAVVTNPAVIALWTKGGKTLEEVIGDTTSRVTTPVYVQLYGPRKDAFISEADYLRHISVQVCPKLPATLDGIAAAKALADKGFKTLITAVCSLEQAYAAAAAGADAICPYVARLNDFDQSAEALLYSINEMYDRHTVMTKVIPASVRTLEEVQLCLKTGCDGVILFYDLFTRMFEHPVMHRSIDGFEKDWNSFRYLFRSRKR